MSNREIFVRYAQKYQAVLAASVSIIIALIQSWPLMYSFVLAIMAYFFVKPPKAKNIKMILIFGLALISFLLILNRNIDSENLAIGVYLILFGALYVVVAENLNQD